ncbi:MAG: transposase [Deltaproteobacteria bacterium]|nr:transposase [Deltaproteobacteria bacterium]
MFRIGCLCAKKAFSVYAWALMDNHFHLLLRTGTLTLSDSMRKLLTGYVVNYNRRHKRYGHLFQNRYKSILCEDDPYLLELIRYIHLNPLRAGVVKTMSELRKYQWCGHSSIMGHVKREWQDVDAILTYFGKRRKTAIEKYEAFVEGGIKAGKRPALVGGGLIRSLGGWSQVVSLKRAGSKVFSDERILGSSDFVKNVIEEAEEKAKQTLRLNSKITNLQALAKIVGSEEGIEEDDLRSGLKSRAVTKARRIFCRIAVGEMGYSGANIVRFLGVTTSAVNRLAVSTRSGDTNKYS